MIQTKAIQLMRMAFVLNFYVLNRDICTFTIVYMTANNVQNQNIVGFVLVRIVVSIWYRVCLSLTSTTIVSVVNEFSIHCLFPFSGFFGLHFSAKLNVNCYLIVYIIILFTCIFLLLQREPLILQRHLP